MAEENEEEDEDKGKEQGVIQCRAIAPIQRRSGSKNGVCFIPRERHVTDVALTAGNTHLYVIKNRFKDQEIKYFKFRFKTIN